MLVSPALFSSALLVPRLLLQGIPFVVWVQDLYGLGIRETGDGRLSFLAGLVGRLEAWTLRHAQSLVVIGERMAMEVNDAGVENDRITVVRNWTHIDPVALADVSAVRARFGWHADETVVLHTGNMGVKQDLKNVVEAARLADSARRPVRFVLVGDGSDRPAVEEAALGVEHVQLLPPQTESDFQSMMQAADVLLVNEHPEVRGMALPSKLTSYFAAGRPVLAASHEFSATSAELRASGAGDRVEAGDPAALLEGVERLAADPVRMQTLADAGMKYRWALLREETAVRSFDRVLKQITATRHHRRAEVVVASSLPSTGEITLRRG